MKIIFILLVLAGITLILVALLRKGKKSLDRTIAEAEVTPETYTYSKTYGSPVVPRSRGIRNHANEPSTSAAYYDTQYDDYEPLNTSIPDWANEPTTTYETPANTCDTSSGVADTPSTSYDSSSSSDCSSSSYDSGSSSSGYTSSSD